MESPVFPEFLARPKRFELLTPRFVVKSHALKSHAIFANYVELVTWDDKGFYPVCKPFRPAQAGCHLAGQAFLIGRVPIECGERLPSGRVFARQFVFPKNVFNLISCRILSHQVEYCVRTAAPDCNFQFQNRDETISEWIATGFLNIIHIRPRYFHSLFPAHPEPLVAPTTSAN